MEVCDAIKTQAIDLTYRRRCQDQAEDCGAEARNKSSKSVFERAFSSQTLNLEIPSILRRVFVISVLRVFSGPKAASASFAPVLARSLLCHELSIAFRHQTTEYHTSPASCFRRRLIDTSLLDVLNIRAYKEERDVDKAVECRRGYAGSSDGNRSVIMRQWDQWGDAMLHAAFGKVGWTGDSRETPTTQHQPSSILRETWGVVIERTRRLCLIGLGT